MIINGCFGKIPFEWASKLVNSEDHERGMWIDASPAANGTIVSIDTIRIDFGEPSNDLPKSILHALNDVFAAGGNPTTICVSYHLSGEPNLDLLLDLKRRVEFETEQMKVHLGKQHTSFGFPFDALTIACVGVRNAIYRPLSPGGLVALVGPLDYAAPLGSRSDNWVEQLALLRTMSATPPPAMKDVSGDGLAGALAQLARRESVAISISAHKVEALCHCADLDDCALDRNYADFAPLIRNYGPIDTSRLRRALFVPGFFGPIVCLDDDAANLSRAKAHIIGEFESGRAALSIKP